jgi:phenylacetate-coenzyme A ligase PaaK-like adenylate-forming protein
MVHISYGYGLFTGGLGAHYGAERLGCTVVPMSGGQTEKQVQLIQDFKPSIIMVTPSYMLNIIEEFQRQGLDPPPARSRSASSAPSRGPTPCAPRSSSAPASTRSTSTACPK